MNNDYLEKILGEQYNMSDYFDNTNNDSKIDLNEKETRIKPDIERYNDNLESLYPDIYKVLEPIVELIVRNHSNKKFDNKLIKKLTDKIYYAVEATNNKEQMKNNSLSKINKDENKTPKNSLLYDLIKILLLNNIIKEHNQKDINNRNLNNKSTRTQINEENINIDYYNTPYPEDQ